MKIYLTVRQWESGIRSTLCVGGETQWVTALLHEEPPRERHGLLTAAIDQQKRFHWEICFPKAQELRLLNVTNKEYFNKKSSCFKNKDRSPALTSLSNRRKALR